MYFLIENSEGGPYIRGYYDEKGNIVPYDTFLDKDTLNRQGEIAVIIPSLFILPPDFF